MRQWDHKQKIPAGAEPVWANVIRIQVTTSRARPKLGARKIGRIEDGSQGEKGPSREPRGRLIFRFVAACGSGKAGKIRKSESTFSPKSRGASNDPVNRGESWGSWVQMLSIKYFQVIGMNRYTQPECQRINRADLETLWLGSCRLLAALHEGARRHEPALNSGSDCA